MNPSVGLPLIAVLALSACGDERPNVELSADGDLSTSGLAFHVDADDTGERLSATVAVENRSAQPLQLEFGACSLEFAAHRSARLDDNGIHFGPGRNCPGYLIVTTLEPGETGHADEFEHSIDLDDVEVEPGTYILAAHLTLNGRVWRMPLGSVTVP